MARMKSILVQFVTLKSIEPKGATLSKCGEDEFLKS